MNSQIGQNLSNLRQKSEKKISARSDQTTGKPLSPTSMPDFQRFVFSALAFCQEIPFGSELLKPTPPL